MSALAALALSASPKEDEVLRAYIPQGASLAYEGFFVMRLGRLKPLVYASVKAEGEELSVVRFLWGAGAPPLRILDEMSLEADETTLLSDAPSKEATKNSTARRVRLAVLLEKASAHPFCPSLQERLLAYAKLYQKGEACLPSPKLHYVQSHIQNHTT